MSYGESLVSSIAQITGSCFAAGPGFFCVGFSPPSARLVSLTKRTEYSRNLLTIAIYAPDVNFLL